MLTILVGNAMPEVKEDLCTNDLHLMPDEIVDFFNIWYDNLDDKTVREYTDIIINYVGDMIEQGKINKNDVKVITKYGEHFYNDDGCLDHTWPYGIYNY